MPPFGGIAFLPFSALLCSASTPVAIRGAQAALSPNFGAPATPAAWQTEQTLSYVPLPSPPPVAATMAVAAFGAAADFFLAAHAANFSGSTASTTMGMKPCSLPHSSAH